MTDPRTIETLPAPPSDDFVCGRCRGAPGACVCPPRPAHSDSLMFDGECPCDECGQRDEVLGADPDPIGPCEVCGAERLDWSSDCDCDDDVAPSWEEDFWSARRAQGG